MNMQQKQQLDSFVRVRAFLEAHPATGDLTYDNAATMLDDVAQRLTSYAGAQESGHQLSRGAVRRQADQIEQILDRHMRPIVTIAGAQLSPEGDAGLPATLRMPKPKIGPTKVLAACDGMIASARRYEQVFVANGLPADFLARFQAARDTLASIMRIRATQVGTHVAARAGLQAQLRRGRLAVKRLDAIVRASFRGDEMALTAWRVAKRVHAVPGGVGSRTTPATPVVGSIGSTGSTGSTGGEEITEAAA